MKIYSEKEMYAFAENLGLALAEENFILFLSGPLGAGKTTLVRGLLGYLGYQGNVKSPTFTLVEPYTLKNGTCYHFDLYRIDNAEELELLGTRDYFASDASCIVEWPEKAEGFLPKPDLAIQIEFVDDVRELHLKAFTEKGNRILNKITLQ